MAHWLNIWLLILVQVMISGHELKPCIISIVSQKSASSSPSISAPLPAGILSFSLSQIIKKKSLKKLYMEKLGAPEWLSQLNVCLQFRS